MSHLLLTLGGDDGDAARTVLRRRRDFSGADKVLEIFEREATALQPGSCLILVDQRRATILRWAGTADPLAALRDQPGLDGLSIEPPAADALATTPSPAQRPDGPPPVEPASPALPQPVPAMIRQPDALPRARSADGSVQYVAKNMRLDLRLIAGMIPPHVRVLDIGCGDGALMAELAAKGVDARGIEIDMQAATEAVSQGLAVIHGDADNDLAFYPDQAFDYVVLSRTLQAVEKPREVLRQMLRIGRHAIVSFPNFGHWEMRLKLLLSGRMPDTETWSRPWYETPNIHPCTILDFFALAELEGYVIEEWLAVDEKGLKAPWRRSVRLANIFGQQALFQLTRR